MATNNPFRPIRAVLKGNSKVSRKQHAAAGFFDEKKKVVRPRKKALADGFSSAPEQNLIYKGGRTIRNLTYANFYIGGKKAWNSVDIKNIDKALFDAMNDAHLNNVMRQYFGNKQIGSNFKKPSVILDGTKPSVFSEGNVKALLSNLFTNGKLAGFDLGNTVFCFFLPQGTILNTDKNPHNNKAQKIIETCIPFEDEDSSKEGLGGYHGSVHVDAKTTVYYAIGVYSYTLPNGDANGIVAFKEPWKNVVATFYHELCEARTDPDVDDAIRTNNSKYCGWVSKKGAECGDYPMEESGDDLSLVMQEVPLANGKGTVPIQFQYSNAVFGPEGPIKKLHKL